MSFRSYRGSYLPLGELLHVLTVNVQWWRYARALYSVAPNTMAKPVTKHHVIENNVTWMNIRSGACEGKQNGRQVRQYGCHSNSVAVQRGSFTKKKTCFTSSDCSAEAICRSCCHQGVSVWSLDQNEHSDGLLLLLSIQVVGIQDLHHSSPRNHHIQCSSDYYTKSQLFPVGS